MLLMKLIPNFSWLARWPLSFMVGIASGLGIVLTMEALVLKQIDATVMNLLVRNLHRIHQLGINRTTLVDFHWSMLRTDLFYFSKEHKGYFFGPVSRIGIYVLMMAFGAAFGYTVMARCLSLSEECFLP